MKRAWLAVGVGVGCGGVVGGPIVGGTLDAGVRDSSVVTVDSGPDAPTDAGVIPDVSDAADAGPDVSDACVLVEHYNGFQHFYDCTPSGTFNAALALEACNAYFDAGCQVWSTSDSGLCPPLNEVGAKGTYWIMWSWWGDGNLYLVGSSPFVQECATSVNYSGSWY